MREAEHEQQPHNSGREKAQRDLDQSQVGDIGKDRPSYAHKNEQPEPSEEAVFADEDSNVARPLPMSVGVPAMLLFHTHVVDGNSRVVESGI
jgi:hypothetical protein